MSKNINEDPKQILLEGPYSRNKSTNKTRLNCRNSNYFDRLFNYD